LLVALASVWQSQSPVPPPLPLSDLVVDRDHKKGTLMSASQADAFIERLSADEAFAAQIDAVKNSPEQVQALVAGAGFDATPEEIREAWLASLGEYLTEEQLAEISGGVWESSEIAYAAVAGTVSVVAVGVIVASCASAAAAA
jgi:predicted ribosomally synthesized peptide with nif11-like leader